MYRTINGLFDSLFLFIARTERVFTIAGLES